MKIATRISAAVSAASLLVLGGAGLQTMRQEEQDLRASIERELQELAAAVRVGVENALRDGQLADVKETLSVLEQVDRSVDLFVFDPRSQIQAQSPGSEDTVAIANDALSSSLRRGSSVFRFEGEDGLSSALLAAPLLADDGARLGTLVLIRPLADVRGDLRRTRAGIIVSVAMLVLSLSVVVLLLGRVLVRRPLASMIAAMRAGRDERFDQVLDTGGSGEIAEALEEFNALTAALREARARLVREEQQRREIEAAIERADRLITVGELAASLAHEIGSPLQILHGRARRLEACAESPSEVRRHAGILVEQTDRIRRIVDQLLTLSRRIPPRFEQVDLLPPVRAVIDLIEPLAAKRGVQLALDAPPGLIARADPDRLQQVVLNLLNNALRATPRGGKITVRLERASLARPGLDGLRVPSARITVEDTGEGMSPEVLAHAFDRFFTTEARQGGNGLGLATARAIAIEHGGTISAESELGGGSRFVTEIPLEGPNASQEVMVA